MDSRLCQCSIARYLVWSATCRARLCERFRRYPAINLVIPVIPVSIRFDSLGFIFGALGISHHYIPCEEYFDIRIRILLPGSASQERCKRLLLLAGIRLGLCLVRSLPSMLHVVHGTRFSCHLGLFDNTLCGSRLLSRG